MFGLPRTCFISVRNGLSAPLHIGMVGEGGGGDRGGCILQRENSGRRTHSGHAGDLRVHPSVLLLLYGRSHMRFPQVVVQAVACHEHVLVSIALPYSPRILLVKGAGKYVTTQ